MAAAGGLLDRIRAILSELLLPASGSSPGPWDVTPIVAALPYIVETLTLVQTLNKATGTDWVRITNPAVFGDGDFHRAVRLREVIVVLMLPTVPFHGHAWVYDGMLQNRHLNLYDPSTSIRHGWDPKLHNGELFAPWRIWKDNYGGGRTS